jgi:hypothetical protein
MTFESRSILRSATCVPKVPWLAILGNIAVTQPIGEQTSYAERAQNFADDIFHTQSMRPPHRLSLQ